MDIRKILEQASQKFGHKTGIIFEDRKITFCEIYTESLKLVNALRACSIGKGDKVAIYLPNSPEYIFSYLACFCLGAVAVPLDFMLKEGEILSCMEHSETKVLIAQGRTDIRWEIIQTQLVNLKAIISIGGEIPGALIYSQLIDQEASDAPVVAIADQDPALIMYTAGTTGKPKGILLNCKHLEGSPKAMEYFVDLTNNDVTLAAIPLSHIGGFIYIQNMLIFGMTLVLMERFNPFRFLECIHQYKVTCFHIVPAMYTAILSLKQIDNFDLSSLRWVVVFGAPSSPEILERFHKYCPNARLLNGWGMTETCPPNTVTPLDSTNIASVGKPAPHCQIKIVNEEGKELSCNEIGEIAISGWIIMDGYYKDPEATVEVKRDGWLFTGDLGRFDKDGFLYIAGRKKEMIKVAGQIVYAPEVEAAFYKNTNVAEIAVIGVPDELRGEVVGAFIALKDAAKTTEDELRDFARKHLANFKVPQFIALKSELPKNRIGKIDKVLLQQEYLLLSNTKAQALRD